MCALRLLSIALTAGLLLLALLVPQARAEQNPCHPDKWRAGLNVTCRKVVIPPKLCTACKLKPFVDNGQFVDCTSIYDLEDEACQAELARYSRYNRHCDPVRAKQVTDFTNPDYVKGLDYFVYSVCEECCDCIPRGAYIKQYDVRKKIGKLFNVARGNCPAHAWYDICKVWPRVKYVTNPGKRLKTKNLPEICPVLTEWIENPANTNWLYRSQVTFNESVNAFLSRFVSVARCSHRPSWERCNLLEAAQKRL